MIIKGYIFSVLYAVLCLAFGLVLYKLGTPKKITRKLVHILVGFEWIILYHFMGPGWHFLFVCLFFLTILFFAYKRKLMPMIASDGENAPGTVYYALAMSIMALITIFLPDMLLPFGIGVCCTSLGDGLAGLLGQCMSSPKNLKIYGKKTIYGTLFNFIVCATATGVFNAHFALGLQSWHIVSIALFATGLELFTKKGLDNISITLGASFLAYFFVNFQGAENYFIPILFTPIIIVFARDKNALTTGGILAAIVLDVTVSLTLGNVGFLLLLLFFVGGIITDKIKQRHKKAGQKNKSECRDSLQVMANGAVSAVCSVLYFATGEKAFLVAFVASLAEALADTSASGIGVLAGKAFDPFRMKTCPVGASGGMSILGTLSSAIGAMIISIVAFAFDVVSIEESLIAALAAFLGAIFDSFLGSLLQVKYRCPVCKAIIEKTEHCGSKTVKHSGLAFVTNDTVNFLGTLFAAFLTYLFLIA